MCYRLDDYIQVLEKEVNIDFCRSMNRIVFDKTVQNDPQTFAFVSVPEKPPHKSVEYGESVVYAYLCEFKTLKQL